MQPIRHLPYIKTAPRATISALPALLAIVLALTAPRAAAQEIHLEAMSTWADHALLGTPLGFGLSLEQAILDGIGLRVGVSVHGDRFRGFGSTCMDGQSGVDCSAEPTNERSRLGVFTVAAPISIVHHPRVRLRVLPSLLMSRVESEQVGASSGRKRGARRMVYGYDIGTEITFAPLGESRFQLVVSAHRAIFHPWRTTLVSDGRAPFDGEIRARRVQLGLSWTR